MNKTLSKYTDYLSSDEEFQGNGQKPSKIKIARDFKKEEINLKKILASQQKIRQRSCEEIQFSKPIITYDDVGIIYPNTINIIQGKKGVHKSRLTEIFCAIMLCIESGKEFLGMLRDCIGETVVLYVDSERNINDQFPHAIQKIKLMSGYKITDNPSNLDFISLIDIPRQERYETLDNYIRELRKLHQDKHLFIVFDVVTDCVGNFNDVFESMKMVDMLNYTINLSNVTFLCIIHENPSAGSEKGRGHVGTELNNKATQVMQIGFEKDGQGNDTDLIRLKFLHSRNTKRLEPIYLVYDDETKGLILASKEYTDEKLALKQTKAGINDISNWLRENLQTEMSKADLVEQLMIAFDCSSRTIEDRVKELVSKGEIEKFKIGRSAFYRLCNFF